MRVSSISGDRRLMPNHALTPPFMAEICRCKITGFSHDFPWFMAKATIGFVL